ncbi:TraR/DksA family transcriptional regulator [Algicella marina]|uniref:TraR/DksA family transcriptional regulator n=1 Tax=Algicella marina TaxID=2683284 RepID=A0A6P1SX37_9RHOB|nr:TraR/DksA C4-type zinc finger protein [Algicella marina]QHQ34230.1 TraR/DksA family transcriptional regulator [Algicella marina]
MQDRNQIRARLERRMAELDGRLHRIEDTLEETPPRDFEDFATEREETEVLEGLGTAGQQEMRRIQAALDRLAAGLYGVCTGCGESIDEDRLAILPETPICRTCAKACS